MTTDRRRVGSSPSAANDRPPAQSAETAGNASAETGGGIVALGSSVADVVVAAQKVLMRRYRLAAHDAAAMLASISEQQQIPVRVLAERLQNLRAERGGHHQQKPPGAPPRAWLSRQH